MSQPAANIPAVAITSCIKPSDFIKNITHPNYRTWSAGMLRHVVNALNGTPVIVTVGGGSFTHINATLSLHEYGDDLIVTTLGPALPVRYSPGQIGETIIPLLDAEAHGRAIQTHREECSAALEYVRSNLKDGEAGTWGHWDVTPLRASVWVAYKPHTTNPGFEDERGTYYSRTIRLEEIPTKAALATV